MTILLHSLAPPDRQTNGMCQPGARPVPPPIRQWMAERLVRPPTDHGVPAQQPRPLHNAATSIPTRHWTNPLYGLWAKPSPLQTRDGQRIHGEDEICHWRDQIGDPQSTGRHDMVLQLKKDSSPYVHTRRPDILRRVRHQNDTSVSEVVTSQTRTLWNRIPSETVSLPSQVTSWNEAVAPSVQCRKAVHCSGRSNPREKTTSPAVMLQANFLWKITFDTCYTNEFLIRVCSRTLSISLVHNTIW